MWPGSLDDVAGSNVSYRGTVTGDALRLRPNEGHSAVTADRYRRNGRVLAFRWQGTSKWVRFKRA